MSIYASKKECRISSHQKEVRLMIREKNRRSENLGLRHVGLTTVLAKTLIFEKGRKTVRSARETTPIGNTE